VSDTGIHEDEDKNPFITKNEEGSRNNKVIINQYCQLLSKESLFIKRP